RCASATATLAAGDECQHAESGGEERVRLGLGNRSRGEGVDLAFTRREPRDSASDEAVSGRDREEVVAVPELPLRRPVVGVLHRADVVDAFGPHLGDVAQLAVGAGKRRRRTAPDPELERLGWLGAAALVVERKAMVDRRDRDHAREATALFIMITGSNCAHWWSAVAIAAPTVRPGERMVKVEPFALPVSPLPPLT